MISPIDEDLWVSFSGCPVNDHQRKYLREGKIVVVVGNERFQRMQSVHTQVEWIVRLKRVFRTRKQSSTRKLEEYCRNQQNRLHFHRLWKSGLRQCGATLSQLSHLRLFLVVTRIDLKKQMKWCNYQNRRRLHWRTVSITMFIGLVTAVSASDFFSTSYFVLKSFSTIGISSCSSYGIGLLFLLLLLLLHLLLFFWVAAVRRQWVRDQWDHSNKHNKRWMLQRGDLGNKWILPQHKR